MTYMTTNTATRRMTGTVRNIHRKRPSPTWEVCFDPTLWADYFPAAHETWITIEWPSGTYRSMVGIKPKNQIYLRTTAQSVEGRPKTRVSDLCERHGLHLAGQITLEVVEPRSRYRVVLA